MRRMRSEEELEGAAGGKTTLYRHRIRLDYDDEFFGYISWWDSKNEMANINSFASLKAFCDQNLNLSYLDMKNEPVNNIYGRFCINDIITGYRYNELNDRLEFYTPDGWHLIDSDMVFGEETVEEVQL